MVCIPSLCPVLYVQVLGVFNLSNDQGIPGTLAITNVRIVWYADMNELYNISVPYLQLVSGGRGGEGRRGILSMWLDLTILGGNCPVAVGYIIKFDWMSL